MRYEESTITSEGQALFARRWLPDSPPKAVMVIVHGYAEHCGRYDYVGRWLAQRGVAVEAFDLRGHGKSPGPRAVVRSFDEYFADLEAELAEVERRHRGVPLFLLGHSMGGGIVAHYVIRMSSKREGVPDGAAMPRPHDFAGILLSGAGIRGRRTLPKPVLWLVRLIGRFFPKVRLTKLNAGDVSRDPDVVALYDSDPLNYRKGMPAGTLLAMIKAGLETNAHLDRFALPLFAFHGSEDVLTDPEGSRQLYEQAVSTDKTLKIYEGFYHEVLNEPEKDEVLADILTWVNAHVEARRATPASA
jgi:alpha-beta hydrolase superfamily lysophospholipase